MTILILLRIVLLIWYRYHIFLIYWVMISLDFRLYSVMYKPDIIIMDFGEDFRIFGGENNFNHNLGLVREYVLSKDSDVHKIIFSGLEKWSSEDIMYLNKLTSSSHIKSVFYFSGKGEITPEFMLSLVNLGVTSMILSVEGPPQIHDSVMGVSGSFRRIVETIPFLNDLGMGTQVLTSIDHRNFSTLPYVYAMLKKYDMEQWNVKVNSDRLQPRSTDLNEYDKLDSIFSYLSIVEKSGIRVNYVDTSEVEQFDHAIFHSGIRPENEILKKMLLDSKELMNISFPGLQEESSRFFDSPVEEHTMLYIKDLDEVKLSPWHQVKLGSLKENSLQEILSSKRTISLITSKYLPSQKCTDCESVAACKHIDGTTHMVHISPDKENKLNNPNQGSFMVWNN